ncbi:MAG: hypothetical protein COB22_07870 [Cycloclasticus sp.]|nr:MAG: hypothetical protein COB22_07870 [Cycloclasticus sp.]
MSKQDYSYIGFGRVFAKEVGGSKNWEVGNCSILNLNATEEEKTLKNYKNGQGDANSATRVESVAFSMTMHDVEQDNLEMMLYGTKSTVAAGSVTDESITSALDGLSRTAQINISSVVVTSSPAGTTYTEGTDYEVTAAGIKALSGGTIPDATALLISYSYSQAEVVEGLTGSAKEYELTFVGLNDAQNGKATVVDMYLVKPSVFSELALIGEDYAAPAVTGKLTADSSKVGAGISQYFKYAYVE